MNEGLPREPTAGPPHAAPGGAPPLPPFPNAPGGPGGAGVAFGLGSRAAANNPFTAGGAVAAATIGAGAYAVASGTGGGAFGGQVGDDSRRAAPGIQVDPALAEQAARQRTEQAIRAAQEGQTGTLGALLPFVDSFVGGKVEGTALEKLFGGGAAARKVFAGVLRPLIGPDPLGAGEEAAIARQNEANRQQRERLAAAALAALSVTRGGAGAGPGADVVPVWEADP